MNERHIQQIFSHYIDKFEYINNKEHNENYKWFIAKRFRELMDDALSKEGMEFVTALQGVRSCTKNMIDNYTQPFHGLVELAKKQPETVKQMFLDLYSDDGGNVHMQEKLIENFFEQSRKLLQEYYPGSYRYKQNSHSVSAYLFLYDPAHHYMYKATQSQIFADCIEYYENWGVGDNIKLDVYYRMCDLIVEQINKSKELLNTDASRFSLPGGENMYPDTEKHVLVFDLIYCCSVYDLFDGITFRRPKTQEKHLISEQRKKAAELYEAYSRAQDEKDRLDEAIVALDQVFTVGTKLTHKVWGAGEVISHSNGCMEVRFPATDTVKKMMCVETCESNLLKMDDRRLNDTLDEQAPVLRRRNVIEAVVKDAERKLQPYREFLE